MFRWRYFDAAGRESGSSQPFEDRAAAEAWLAETWPDLRARGVEEVALVAVEGGGTLYRMELGEDR